MAISHIAVVVLQSMVTDASILRIGNRARRSSFAGRSNISILSQPAETFDRPQGSFNFSLTRNMRLIRR